MGALGDTLRERRQHLGISLDQAESATRIRARLLEALEKGDYDRLPAPGYVRGYVSSYARYLELDPVPLLALYKAEAGVPAPRDLNLPQTHEAVAPMGQQHAVPWRAAVSVLMVVALVSLSIWVVTRIWQGPEPTPPEPVVPVQETTTVEPTETPTFEAVEQPARVLPFTLNVRIAEEGASWLRITVDGLKAYEGTLAGGQSKEFEVTDEAKVRVGRPDDVTVLRDGEEVKLPNGDTPTLTLKAKPAE